jgi:diguanylate cyclase (GGDEF)-like protein
VGDEVISHLGHLLRQGLRTSDIPGRIGGEEFAVLLPKINLGQAQALTERLRQSLENNPVPTSAGPLVVHASFGVYPITRKTADAAQCLHRADMALYDAKNNGRNQVRTWHPGLQPR